MTQVLLTKETSEIIRLFRNIDSLSKMLDKQEEKLRPILNGEGYITEHEEDDNTKMICEQLYDLAKLQNAPLSPEAMTKFVTRSNDIMMLLTK